MGMYKGVTTSELDELTAETAANLASLHPDFGVLAARISVSNLHKSTLKSFSETATILYNYIEPKTGKAAPMLADNVYEFIQKHAAELNGAIVYDRDFGYDYFGENSDHAESTYRFLFDCSSPLCSLLFSPSPGFKTLQHSYLLKVNGKVRRHTRITMGAGLTRS
jgi:hypothetical protein